MKSEIGQRAPSLVRRRVVFDVSTLFIWDRPPVGIVRVQYELAAYLLKQDDFPVAFVRFSSDRAKLNPVSLDVVTQRLEEMRSAGSALAARRIAEQMAIQKIEEEKEGARTIVMPEAVKFSARARTFTKAGLKLMVPKNQRKNVRAAWNVYRAAGTAAVFKKLTRRALGYEPQASPIPESVATFLPPASTSHSLEMHVPGALTAAMTQGDFLSSEDILVSAGLDWDHSNYELLYWMKNRLGFGFSGIFYDTIPIEHPEYANSLEFPRRFFNYFYYLNNLADRISCISEFSRSRYLAVARQLDFRETPILQTVLMGDRLANYVEEFDAKTRALPEKYVLYVSSIEARKNHETLLAAWQRGIEEGSSMPDLVCVGMRGWGVDDMFVQYERDGRLRAKIHFLSDVDDRELAEIYRRSLFCVFPSRVEGWGLGAAEAMTYGKVCIVSTAPALIEATRGMMPAIKTEDVQGWRDAILHWSSNDALREKLEERIRNEFIPKDWSTYAKEVFAFALNQ
ncbi:glycosyltransferase family 1 protein [Variovorax sp. RKNM96]|uniref:glycosyltransferase family 4 protein n=1 Tax=Variovorax sp. RKNM96 TaxID=2681552 RepID=UPI00197E5215|nr:glycosyltransferase family 1 protein [Variovorax sp. RKNM96]